MVIIIEGNRLSDYGGTGIRMGRLERFREARIQRKRYILSAVLIAVLFLSGVCIADYSVNSLLKNEKRIDILTMQKINNYYFEINFLNQKLFINTTYIKRDFENFKGLVKQLFHS